MKHCYRIVKIVSSTLFKDTGNFFNQNVSKSGQKSEDAIPLGDDATGVAPVTSAGVDLDIVSSTVVRSTTTGVPVAGVVGTGVESKTCKLNIVMRSIAMVEKY